MKIKASDLVLKLLGVLLLTAAVLKAHELLTVPVANKDIWSYRPFLIFQVEFEFALGIWLLSSIFKRLAWLATLVCFGLFSCVTLYKGLSGAASCGCFGRVHVNPWITLIVIDLTAVLALITFRPKAVFRRLSCSYRFLWRSIYLSLRALRSKAGQSHFTTIVQRSVAGVSRLRFIVTSCILVLILGTSTPLLVFNKPAVVTSQYEVLEPETWIGKNLPILEHIDICEQLKSGTWLVLFYHYDCPDCTRVVPRYEQMARDLAGTEDLPKIAFIAVPPYGRGAVSENCPCTLGRLDQTKEWFVTTPAVALLTDGQVTSAWAEKAPDFETIIQEVIKTSKNSEKSRFFISSNHITHSLLI
ncbi:MAG: hypothetical protein GY774_05480 [Planctomycetes bacterium]|nr:hypothetical protein [Planctomycetota bacterium]